MAMAAVEQWEYRFETCTTILDDEDVPVIDFNALGAEGWELAFMSPNPMEAGSAIWSANLKLVAIFKRRKV